MSERFHSYVQQIVCEAPHHKSFQLVDHSVIDIIGAEIMSHFKQLKLRVFGLSKHLISRFEYLITIRVMAERNRLNISLPIECEIKFLS